MSTTGPPITELLHDVREGRRDAVDALFSRVYDELHRVALGFRPGGAGQTLSATALVHETYLKLLSSASQEWEDREHFFRVAARAMRQILLNAARARRAQKRGGGAVAVTLDEGAHAMPMRDDVLISLDAALERLAGLDPRAAEIVELRFFAGLSVEETAEVLGISAPTVKRSWRASRAWLLNEVGSDDDT
jgi:RNA polymerase sigma factor (TIGR02999 family)